jgi:glutathione S-transferase
MHELGFNHDAKRVDLKNKTLEDGTSYLSINPKGSVPALEIESGEVLTENAVILQFLGDRAGSPDVLPSVGTFRRYRVLEKVNFITTELHKRFSYLFDRNASDDMKRYVIEALEKKLDYIDSELDGNVFLMGDELTLPDPYLFVITGWAEKMLRLDRWSNLTAFRERMLQRPAVRHVLRFEGLLQEEPA